MKNVKKLIYNHLLNELDEKVKTAKQAVISAKESRDSETKSSAGDKHETGRAMSQIELENSEVQLSKVVNLRIELSQIDIEKEYNRVELGSLVDTNQGIYFISIGIGKVEINDETYYAISLASPIGSHLHMKEIGDQIIFQEKEITINNIA